MLSVPFGKAATDETGGNPKVQRRNYLSAGSLPIIDQGQTDVAGYTDDLELAYRGPLPVVLFGDHTRALKYVDQPFALGADGVKVLQPRDGFSAKFLYYYWLAIDIPNHGYSRHFKFLKDIAVPIFAPSEQRRIVEILDQADALRKRRRDADAKAARILPALFLKMFGDPATNPMGWSVKKLSDVASTTSGGTPDTKNGAYYGSAIPWIKSGELSSRTVTRTEQTITEEGLRNSSAKWIEPGAILVAMYGATVGQVARLGIRATTNQAICAITPGTAIEPEFLAEFLRLSKQQLLDRRVGGAQPNISQQIIRALNVPVPPSALQQQFARIAWTMEATLDELSALQPRLGSLSCLLAQRAFSGQLTAKWRQAHMQELLVEMQEQARLLNLPTPN